VKLGLANMLQVSYTRLSALPRVRGQWTDASRSAHRSSSETFASTGPPSTCAKTPKYRNPSFPKNLVKGVQHARARVLNLDFSTTLYTSRMRKQYSTILCNPSNQRKQPLALTSPTWARGLTRVLRESACPHGAKTPEKQNSCFSTNPVKWLPTRARGEKIRLFDQPYNPRMLTQESVTRTNPDKGEAKPEPGGANTFAQCAWVLSLASRWTGGHGAMGAIHRLWPVAPVTGARACVRGRQLRRVTVRCQLLDRYRWLSEIISREIAGNRRGTGGLTEWLVSLWR
jgi:hypothetical protein